MEGATGRPRRADRIGCGGGGERTAEKQREIYGFKATASHYVDWLFNPATRKVYRSLIAIKLAKSAVYGKQRSRAISNRRRYQSIPVGD